MTTIHVAASRAYDIEISRGLLDQAGEHIARVTGAGRTAAVISDTNVLPLYGQRLCDSLERAGFRPISWAFPAGEESKNLTTYGRLLHFLGENHMTRSDIIVALGGGVTGDMAGFAAATYQRGIPFIQVPTTLLAAVDSSVGGKTAIDLETGKNQAGCFYQPWLVLCDPDTLTTLPEREYRCGCGEIIKYSVLFDAHFFEELQSTPVKDQVEHVISTCVTLKRRAVMEDEFDTGERRKLNLGHSFGHAVEACSDFSIPHGCAVAIGMAIITRAAVKRGICAQEVLDRLLAILDKYDLPTQTDYPLEALYRAALSDKKISGGKMHLIVPEAIGRCDIVSIPEGEIPDWLRDGGVQ